MRITQPEVFCFSDIHLGIHPSSPVWNKIPLDFADWIAQKAQEQNIKDIIIPGDIVDDRNEISVLTLHYLPQFFKKLANFNIIIVVGNHDCYYNDRSDVHPLGTLSEWENITIIDKPTLIHSFGKNIMFCPWGTKLNEIQPNDITFGHFNIQSFKETPFHVSSTGYEPQQLLDQTNLLISGHYHIYQERTYKKGSILYVGSPYEQTWKDFSTPKGIVKINLAESKYQFIENPISPKHRKVYLTELLKTGITSTIKKEFTGNIVKLFIDDPKYNDVVDPFIEKLSVLKPMQLLIEKIVENNISLDDKLEMKEISVQEDIISFVNALEKVENKEDVIKYIKEVYEKAENANLELEY